MRIHLQGRGGATADDELFSRVEKKLEKVAKQVSPLAELTIELREERDPAGSQVAEATLRLKGTTLRACERSLYERGRNGHRGRPMSSVSNARPVRVTMSRTSSKPPAGP